MRTRVLVVVAVALAAVAACGDTTSGEPVAGSEVATTGASAEPTTATPTATATPTRSRPATTTDEPEPDDQLLLGPAGWGPIVLGMSPEDAAATGVFADMPAAEPGGCVSWTAVNAAPIESIMISPQLGVAAIAPRDTAPIRTPEGIGFGSTADEVAAAYPDFTVDDVDIPNGARVAVPGADAAVFRMSFTDAAQVSFLTLELLNQDCYG